MSTVESEFLRYSVSCQLTINDWMHAECEFSQDFFATCFHTNETVWRLATLVRKNCNAVMSLVINSSCYYVFLDNMSSVLALLARREDT
jgi:hypothetical protein